MSSNRRIAGLAGLFDEREALLGAARLVRDAGYKQWDCHTPYPVHGLDEAMGLPDSPIPCFTIGAGFVGASLAMLMQWWMSAVDLPLTIGGKPLFSWPAFIPITFEWFVLFAALTTTACLVVFCRLGRWYSPLYDQGVMAQVTTRRFAVFVSARDEHFSEETVRRRLEEAGCKDIRALYEDDDDGTIL